MEATNLGISTDEYRRRARRLRSRHGADPDRLHRRLRELSCDYDAGHGNRAGRAECSRKRSRGGALMQAGCSDAPVTVARDTERNPADPRELVYQSFMESIAWHLDGTLLRYTNRRRLLSLGRSLGIGEFEANLLMAAVLHQARQVVVPEKSDADSRWRQMLVIVLVQLAIFTAFGAIIWRLI